LPANDRSAASKEALLSRSMESHSEGGLDRIVHDQFFAGATAGVFVDVGAARPDYLSMSAIYRTLGWRIIAIEPNPIFCQAYREAGHEVLEYACADRDEDNVNFEIVDSHGAAYEEGAVTFESFSALTVKDSYESSLSTGKLDVRSITVNVRKLDTLLAEHAPELEHMEIVSIDVEGWELEVLRGFSLERYRPSVLIIENVLDEAAYQQALGARGYKRWMQVPPNDVYVPA
jgi:FkbM family methyltransferase